MQNADQPDLTILDFNTLPKFAYDDAYVTIGNFDGVHLGHQAIISQMLTEAQQQAQPVIVVTFYPNPAVFFNPPGQPFYLSTPREKESHLLALGVDQVITLKFNHDFSQLTAEAFLKRLQQSLGMRSLVVGADFALGKGRQGTIPVLEQIGQAYGFTVRTIPQIDLGGKEVSSTRIRQHLDRGAVDRVADLLGRHYSVRGEVTHGSDRGARIGLPTANITHWPHKKLPAVGVYATRVELEGVGYLGITNIGFRPTFESQSQVNVETHILDFDDNIYGKRITLAFIEKLRDEQKFPDIEAFLAQIEQDKACARRIFANAPT